ncbi:hypothetical protein HQ544_03895 [Candidatus Falkowbacteria bacterium]|nr:hypothetical protein [Candidatus Falkowbacteria bacterium]
MLNKISGFLAPVMIISAIFGLITLIPIIGTGRGLFFFLSLHETFMLVGGGLLGYKTLESARRDYEQKREDKRALWVINLGILGAIVGFLMNFFGSVYVDDFLAIFGLKLF